MKPTTTLLFALPVVPLALAGTTNYLLPEARQGRRHEEDNGVDNVSIERIRHGDQDN